MITYKHIINPKSNKTLDNIIKWSKLIDDYTELDNYLIIQIDGLIDIGYILYYQNHIYKCEIKKEFQRSSYGTKLLQKFEEFITTTDENIYSISLTAKTIQVVEFYEKCGYELEHESFNRMRKLI